MALIAISESELDQYGCPSCGYAFGSILLISHDSKTWTCDKCETSTIVVKDSATNSSISILLEDNDIYPNKVSHPRKGLPCHVINKSNDQDKIDKRL